MNDMNDQTLRPEANDRTIRLDASQLNPALDRTIVADRTVMDESAATAPADVTLRPDVQPHATEVPPAGETFVIKGDVYAKKKCLSDNSGEAQVFLVERGGKEYVLKVYYPNFDINKKLMQVVRNFQFEMIMDVFDFGKTYVEGKHRYYELMEYLRGGTLQDYDVKGNIDQFRRIALQAAAALAYCHKNNILHKDIKPGNFFFRDEKQRQLVLGDFGISSMLEKDGKTYRTTQARTPIYAAPEMYTDVIDGEVEITPAADYYSLGMTLFAVWLGENPMSSNERVMMRQKNEGRLPRLNELPERVRQIVMGLTAVNPPSRWKYEQVERWFLGENVPVDTTSPFLRYKSFIVDPERNLVAENVHELIPLLLDNERLAENYLYNGRIASWLESCGNGKLATTVKDIVTNRYPVDKYAGLMASVYAMEPSYPYYDVQGIICDDIHSVSISLLGNQQRYSIDLQNPNDRLFIWLESHTKADVARLRSYFVPEGDGRVALLKLIYEIDTEVPFLTHCPSATIQEIVYAYGHSQLTEDDWKALTDGRLLSWMYARGDVMACESLRILTKDQPYSESLAYKVLYNMDREAAYDLRDTRTPEAMGHYLAERLKQVEHLSAEELATHMEDIASPNGRFAYFAEMHGWHDILTEANRCFDLNSEENRERLSAYDLRTALYRFCRILGVVPTYLLPNGMELTDGRKLENKKLASYIKSELRSGCIAQWISVFYHEDPTRDFIEEYSYEHELEDWLMALGRFDNQQQYYKRFLKAREETAQKVQSVRSQWFKSKVRERAWRFVFYGTCAVWLALVLLYGVTGHDYLLREHWAVSMILPVGGMLGIVVGIRAFFRGYGFLMSVLWGSLGVAVSFALLYALRFVDSHLPDYFNVVVALLTVLFMVVVHFTDFRRDNQTDASFVRGVLNGEDIKASLLDPLYYTFKTKSLRYKSSKFGVLDDLNDQMRSVAGETSIHYALCSILMAILIAMFFAFSPRFIDMKLPSKQDMKQEQIMELIEKTTE